MRTVFGLLIFWSGWLSANTELLIVGDRSQPVSIVVLPMTYQGDGLSPTVTIENALTQALSSTGLFTMPMRYTVPEDPEDLLAWRLIDVRFVISGQVVETEQNLMLNLSIQDTLGLRPTLSSAALNPDTLGLSVQAFADQLYRSLFYATFTNDNDKQYLVNENPTLTRYLNALISHIKGHWREGPIAGQCQVQLKQLPGGDVFKHKLLTGCFDNPAFGRDIERLFEDLNTLPYEGYQDVFIKDLLLTFVRS